MEEGVQNPQKRPDVIYGRLQMSKISVRSISFFTYWPILITADTIFFTKRYQQVEKTHIYFMTARHKTLGAILK